MPEQDDAVQEFLIESHEKLDRLDQDLVHLERNPSERKTLDRVFRTIHTIKGTCGVLGFSKLEHIAHAGESLLSRLRDGKLQMNSAITTATLALVDAARQILATIEEHRHDGDDAFPELVQRLTSLLDDDGTEGVTPAPVAPHTNGAGAPAAAVPGNPPRRVTNSLIPVAGRVGDLLVKHGLIPQGELAVALEMQRRGDKRRIGDILVALGVVKESDIDELLARTKARPGGAGEMGKATDKTVRVDVEVLDALMNLLGELVLVRDQILQHASTQRDPAFLRATQRLDLVTGELQERVMRTRRQPINSVLSRFPRIVRDLAVTCGKRVRVEIEGQQTELDKALIEAISDPLTHLVRNAVDHGIERPDQRTAAGKNPEGVVLLRVYHESGHVNIEVTDDGDGIRLDKVRQKALERGFVTQAQATHMSEHELINLIFLPGLSTAERVTNVSGRGVGMDVVKTNIERIGGTVEIRTSIGRGSTFRLRIPSTLAIISR